MPFGNVIIILVGQTLRNMSSKGIMTMSFNLNKIGRSNDVNHTNFINASGLTQRQIQISVRAGNLQDIGGGSFVPKNVIGVFPLNMTTDGVKTISFNEVLRIGGGRVSQIPFNRF